jgi:DNA invertase Pin-like site-specific DNA recombinase
MVKQTQATSVKVFSYLRYSTVAQGQEGRDSERRQIEATKAWAVRHGHTFDESLQRADRGVSGFRGKHRRRGNLAAFLADVETGRVPAGSILAIENLDRLSREGFGPAFEEIIRKLWKHDITLWTVSPEECYPPHCEKDPKFIALWLYLNRANEESERKSNMMRAAHAAARAKASANHKTMGGRCPAWLIPQFQVAPDGRRIGVSEYKVCPGADRTIRAIFAWKLQGLGIARIVSKLNHEKGWWTPPLRKGRTNTGWKPRYVRKILTCRSVLGEWQPYAETDTVMNGEPERVRKPVGEPIPDYFKRIIDDGTFRAVQQQLAQNGGAPGTKGRQGGPTGQFANLFRGLLRCGYCQGAVYRRPKAIKEGAGRAYLRCDNGGRGTCHERHSVAYGELEQTILQNLKGLKPEQVLPSTDEATKRLEALRQKIAGQQAQVQDLTDRMANFTAQIGRTKDDESRDEYQAARIKCREEKTALEETLKADWAALAKGESARADFTKWQADLATLQRELEKKDNADLRMKCHAHLRQLVDRVEVFFTGFSQAPGSTGRDEGRKWRNGKQWAKLSAEEKKEARKPGPQDYTDNIADELEQAGADPDFIRYVELQRQTRRGRFFRVYFVSGFWIDLVPDGGIASGMRLYYDKKGKPGWKFTSPDFKALWKEYQSQK